MSYRRSAYDGDLAYGNEHPQRWDRDRFERARARSRGPPVRESESIRFDERDYGPRKDVSFSERFDERIAPPPRRRVDYYEDDYIPPRRARPEFLDRDPHYETTGRELAPWRERYDAPHHYPPARRPGYIRRQSSWDAGDRPRPRYDDDAQLDVSVRINSPPHPPPEREHRYHYPDVDEEDYRDVRIRREREIYRRAPSRPPPPPEEDFAETVSTTTVREESPPPPPKTKIKRGRTKMPKRLVHKRAIIDLGYPYVEEEDFFIVQIAMTKEQIDTVIKVSETYKTVYQFDDAPKQLEPPPPPESSHHHHPVSEPGAPPPPPAEECAPEEVTETVTTKIIENPTPEELEKYRHRGDGDSGSSSSDDGTKKSHSHAGRTEIRSPSSHHSRRRGRSRAHRDEVEFEERIEERESLGGPITLVDRSRRRSEREIKEDIRALEEQKRLIRLERDSDSYEIVEPVEVVRVEKDRNGHMFLERRHPRSKSRRRSRSRRVDPRVVSAALNTLT